MGFLPSPTLYYIILSHLFQSMNNGYIEELNCENKNWLKWTQWINVCFCPIVYFVVVDRCDYFNLFVLIVPMAIIDI